MALLTAWRVPQRRLQPYSCTIGKVADVILRAHSAHQRDNE